MKRLYYIYILMLPLLFFSYRAKGVNSDSISRNSIIVSSHIETACPGSNMNGNNPGKKQTFILFRKGIEGKSILFFYGEDIPLSYVYPLYTDSALINAARIKQVLLFSDLIAVKPEFLSSFSFRPPPVFC